MCFVICNVFIYIFTTINLKTKIMSREISYTTRTFYVPAEKIETLVKFQGKCKENGHKSYSEVLLSLMEKYNEQ